MCGTAMEAKEGHHLWDRFVLPVGKVKTQVEVESILIKMFWPAYLKNVGVSK